MSVRSWLHSCLQKHLVAGVLALGPSLAGAMGVLRRLVAARAAAGVGHAVLGGRGGGGMGVLAGGGSDLRSLADAVLGHRREHRTGRENWRQERKNQLVTQEQI